MLQVVGVALLILAVYIGIRAARWEQGVRIGYGAVALLAVVGGGLLVAGANSAALTIKGLFIGYIVASSGSGMGRREFSSLEKERAWNQYQQSMVQNRWYNLALGLGLIAFSVWRASVVA